jgi:phosphoribosylamine-glycine ligase
MFKVVIGRTAKAHGGHEVAKEIGVNSWAAFARSDDNAVVGGDFALLQGVLEALRKAGINVVAIHHHMSGSRPPSTPRAAS